MGSSASKTAGAAARKYPSRPPPISQATSNAPTRPPPTLNRQQPGPTVKPQAQASGTRDQAINLDASDPDFARSLRSLGPVQPNPTLSPSSAFPHGNNPNSPSQGRRSAGPDPRKNPAIMVLESRSRLQSEADAEFGRSGSRAHEGRQFLDVYAIRQILVERDQMGRSPADIERKMGLKQGVVARLGAKGIVGLAKEQGRANRGIDIV